MPRVVEVLGWQALSVRSFNFTGNTSIVNELQALWNIVDLIWARPALAAEPENSLSPLAV